MTAADLMSPYEFYQLAAITERTAIRWRVAGTGPSYVKVGRRVRYLRSSVDAWLASNTYTMTA
jgi:predicted DNA-binding transcriptional regulator AlpA